jgi:Zn-dependent peptidase ImmA (M78 family)
LGFVRGFKANANRIAIEIREKVGVGPMDRLDPSAVCERFDIQLLALRDLCPTSAFLQRGYTHLFSAVTVQDGCGIAIVHNCAHHPDRQRSNICHELAHCFLGHPASPPLTEEGERVFDSGIEAEANFLGGSLLIPDEAAKHIVRSGLQNVAARTFGVSGQMLQYRLRMSGALTIERRRQARGG